jgi:aryl-alcohol dehydrogenase-like predicted oxidoreductase
MTATSSTAYTLAKPAVTSLIVGARTEEGQAAPYSLAGPWAR